MKTEKAKKIVARVKRELRVWSKARLVSELATVWELLRLDQRDLKKDQTITFVPFDGPELDCADVVDWLNDMFSDLGVGDVEEEECDVV